mgnify:CR=1 FL=1
MLKKILLSLLFLITVNNCDYSPVYLKGENSKLNINIIKIDGDNEINKVITNEIGEIANNKYSKAIDIKINTNYTRTILARNTKGTPTDFELKAIFERVEHRVKDYGSEIQINLIYIIISIYICTSAII